MSYQKTNIGDTGQQLIDNLDANFSELYGRGVAFSDTEPTGDWRLWLFSFGGITKYPKASAPEPLVKLVLETAPLDALGNIIMKPKDGAAFKVTNMTDDPNTAKPNDIIVAET